MYCQCDDFHQKISIKSLQDQFWWIVKGHHCVDHEYFVKLTNSYVICDVWCVMHDMWCSRFDFFVRSWLYELREDQNHPIWVISDLFNDIPKLIPGGSRMYAISCKASYASINIIGIGWNTRSYEYSVQFSGFPELLNLKWWLENHFPL